MQEPGIMIKMVKNNQQGFSLIEIMIAVTIFTIGILATGAMQMRAVSGNSFASGLTEATAIAQAQMEKLMALSYTDSALNDTDNDKTAGLDDASTTTADGSAQYTGQTGTKYNIFWNVAVDSPVANTKQIRIIVQWTFRTAGKKVSLDFIKAMSQ
jgi:type IV pilus assembly protein PilV